MTKILHLVRHAEAVEKKQGLPDPERPLIRKGAKAAGNVARRLRKSGYSADYMISSPANRALETAHIFAKEFEYRAKKIELNQAIYDAPDNSQLLSMVRNIPASSSQAFLFGHDSSLSDFAHYLIPGFEELMPKGAVVTVEFACDSWTEITPGMSKFIRFDYPVSKSERKHLHKLSRREITAGLASTIRDELKQLNPQAAEKAMPYIEKVSRTVADHFLKLAPPVKPPQTSLIVNQHRRESEPMDKEE